MPKIRNIVINNLIVSMAETLILYGYKYIQHNTIIYITRISIL